MKRMYPLLALVGLLLIAWPATIPLAIAHLARWYSRDEESPLWRAVHHGSLPLIVALWVHTAFAAIIAGYIGQSDRVGTWAEWSLPVARSLEPWVLPSVVTCMAAAGCLAWCERRRAIGLRQLAQVVVGLSAFAAVLPAQVHHSANHSGYTYNPAADPFGRLATRTARARGVQRMAAARVVAATAAADDVAMLSDLDAERLAITFHTIATSRAYAWRAPAMAFALGVIDSQGDDSIDVRSICLTRSCFDKRVVDRLSERNLPTRVPEPEGVRLDEEAAAQEERRAVAARAAAGERFIARLDMPLAALKSGGITRLAARAYLTGMIDLHAARLALDGLPVPPMPARAVTRNHPSLPAGALGRAHPLALQPVQERVVARLKWTEGLIDGRKRAEYRADRRRYGVCQFGRFLLPC